MININTDNKLYNYLLYILPPLLILLIYIIKYYKNKIYRYMYKKLDITPNIIHFVFGLSPHTMEFQFVHYISILSSYEVNNPNNIYLHYRYEPHGIWWEKTKEIPNIVFKEITNVYTHIKGRQVDNIEDIKKILEIEIIYEYGGIIIDINTISIRPYEQFIQKKNTFLFTNNSYNSLFDSISIAPPSSRFFKLIIDNIYNEYYKHGTKSIKGIFIDKYNKFRPLVNLVPAAITYIPESDNHINLFTNNAQISNELIIFNLLQNIKNKNDIYMIDSYDWIKNNPHTLYSNIVTMVLPDYII